MNKSKKILASLLTLITLSNASSIDNFNKLQKAFTKQPKEIIFDYFKERRLSKKYHYRITLNLIDIDDKSMESFFNKYHILFDMNNKIIYRPSLDDNQSIITNIKDYVFYKISKIDFIKNDVSIQTYNIQTSNVIGFNRINTLLVIEQKGNSEKILRGIANNNALPMMNLRNSHGLIKQSYFVKDYTARIKLDYINDGSVFEFTKDKLIIDGQNEFNIVSNKNNEFNNKLILENKNKEQFVIKNIGKNNEFEYIFTIRPLNIKQEAWKIILEKEIK